MYHIGMAGKKKVKKKVSKKKKIEGDRRCREVLAEKSGAFVRCGKINRWTYPTDEIIEQTCAYLRQGAYIESAVILAGVPKTEFYKWIKIANDDRKKSKYKAQYIKYKNAVDKAIEECSQKDLACIDQTVIGRKAEFLKDENGKMIIDKMGKPIVELPYLIPNWKAAAWRLSRRRPKQWGDHKDPQEHNHSHSMNENSNTLEIKFVNAKNPTPDNVVSTKPMDTDD